MSDEVHLIGNKVRLDSFTLTDLQPAYVNWLNDPEVVRYSNQRFATHTIESCRAYLATFENSHNLFLSVKTLTGWPIGTMSAYRDVQHGTADVGIMIGERGCWGSGYGQNAWNTLLDWLIDCQKVRKVTAGTLTCNTGMVRLMERSGMSMEGVRREQELVDGRPEDIILYGKFAR